MSVTLPAIGLVLLAAATLAVLVMFIPAFIELKKPHDAGPRLINDDFIQTILSNLTLPIQNIDASDSAEQLNVKVMSLLVFSNLEASFI